MPFHVEVFGYSWSGTLSIGVSVLLVEVLDSGIRLTPSPNFFRFPAALILWTTVSACRRDQRISDELDGARHTEVRVGGDKVKVRVPGDAGDRVAAEWALWSSRHSKPV